MQEPPAYISLTPSVHLFICLLHIRVTTTFTKKCIANECISVEYYNSKYSGHPFKLKNSRKTNCLSLQFALLNVAQYLSWISASQRTSSDCNTEMRTWHFLQLFLHWGIRSSSDRLDLRWLRKYYHWLSFWGKYIIHKTVWEENSTQGFPA